MASQASSPPRISSPPPTSLPNDTHYSSATTSTTDRLHRERDRSLSPHYSSSSSSRYNNNSRYERDIDRYRQDERLSHHHHQLPPHLPPPPPPSSSVTAHTSSSTSSHLPPPHSSHSHGLPPPPPPPLPHHHHHHHHHSSSHRRDYRDEGRFDDRYSSRSHDRYGRYDDSRYDSRMRRSGGDYRSYGRHHDDRRPYRYESKPRFRRPVNRGTEEDRQKSTIIFVGNLPYSFRERDVATMFERYGKIVKITIPIDNVTTKNKGFSFVEFEERRDAEEAFENFQGFSVEGRRLKLDWDIGLTKKDTRRPGPTDDYRGPPPGNGSRRSISPPTGPSYGRSDSYIPSNEDDHRRTETGDRYRHH